LVSSGASVDFQNAAGITPAMFCCLRGHPEILQFLIEQGATKDLADNRGWAPLQVAAVNITGQQCVSVLLRHGAEVDATNLAGETALWLASKNGHLPIVKLLVQGGAKIKRAATNGKTPIVIAREQGHAQVAEYLETAVRSSESEIDQ
jgi:ankyrin repeat protein